MLRGLFMGIDRYASAHINQTFVAEMD